MKPFTRAVGQAVIVALAATAGLAGQAPGTAAGSLTGCITRPEGEALSGVTVTITVEHVQRTTITDLTGCYRIGNLPVGSGTLTARLSGFVEITPENVTITQGSPTQLGFEMQIAPVWEIDWIGPPATLAELWKEADAVVHLRITSHEPWPVPPVSHVKHTAALLSVWKRHPIAGPEGATSTFLQEQWTGETVPYNVGQELVLFMHWWPEQTVFVRSHGPYAVFAIQDGRIQGGQAPVVAAHAGMKVDDFLAKLRSLSASQ